ncbi:hypothetical protein BLNAU_163 [Blattamonas nauphoetae]|uniref:C2H2-type domain-containing protein n=1 Tax=Blattamonas nauphoetae TaxID=2049346 RepID=A0ABQ9YM74_9EUKA|nr:hypothetical protein BLNAU_163 [Blattamonas nauphoetae]
MASLQVLPNYPEEGSFFSLFLPATEAQLDSNDPGIQVENSQPLQPEPNVTTTLEVAPIRRRACRFCSKPFATYYRVHRHEKTCRFNPEKELKRRKSQGATVAPVATRKERKWLRKRRNQPKSQSSFMMTIRHKNFQLSYYHLS